MSSKQQAADGRNGFSWRWGVVGLCLTALLPFAFTCDSGFSDRASDSVNDANASLGPDDDDAATESVWAAGVQERLRNEEYRIKAVDPDTWRTFNRAHHLTAWFDRSGVMVSDPRRGDWLWTYRFAGLARLSETAPESLELGEIGDIEPATGVCDERMGPGQDGGCLPLLVYERGALTEWYANRPVGLEQGFTIPTRPAGDGLLVVAGTVGGDLEGTLREDAALIEFSLAGKPVLEYHSLIVTDLTGRRLEAWMEYADDSLWLVIDDLDAVYPIEIDPSLSPTPDWTVESDQVGGRLGFWVADAGDVNNDGYDDVIIGAPYMDNGQIDEGLAYVYLGSASGLETTPVWSVESNQATAHLGRSVSGAGDVNNDGFDDVIIGLEYYDNGNADEGAAWLFYGSASGPSATPDWEFEADQNSAHVGFSVAGAGDVNDDGFDDVIVGAFKYDNGQTDEGTAWVFHGSAGGLSTSPDWSAEGNQAEAFFGRSVDGAGDVNNDGFADVIVGASEYTNGQTDEGRAFVYLGSAAGLNGTAVWTGEPNQARAYFGISVAGAGDVNGDNFDDIIVGANSYDNGQTNEGRAYVYFGSAAGPSAAADWTAEADYNESYFGSSVASAGDVDNDGYSDVIIGATRYTNGENWEGRAYLYHGSAAGPAAEPQWTYEGNVSGAYFGWCVSTAGDVNNDGFSDVIIGAERYDHPEDQEGRVFVFHGGYCQTGCFIEMVCYADGTVNPDNECEVCNIAVSQLDWSDNDGAECDDGEWCTGADTCGGGSCSVHEYDSTNPRCPENGLYCDGEEFCDEDNDECDVQNVPDCSDNGLYCDGEEYCDENNDECGVQNVPSCPDNGLYCDGEEYCNEDIDSCDRRDVPDCSDNSFYLHCFD